LSRVEIYTDGACRGNPGVGGWGALLRFRDRELELFGGEPATTNNRMELTAAIQALAAVGALCAVLRRTAGEAQDRLAGVDSQLRGMLSPGEA